MNKFILLIALIFIVSCAHLEKKGTCMDPNAYPSKVVKEIPIKAFSKKPSFYYLSESWVVFIAPEDMQDYLASINIKNDQLPSYKLIQKIKSESKLEAHKDLLQYNFETWDYGVLIESLVIGLAQRGQVSVVAPGGRELEFITSVEHNEAFGNYLVIHAGEENVNAMLFERYCIAD
jgi:hypothetical protein